MKKQLSSLFEYDKWANASILNALTQLMETDETRLNDTVGQECLDIMAHILLAEMVWYSRIANVPGPQVWEKKTLEQCKDLYEANNEVLIPFFLQLADELIEKSIEYKNTKGIEFSNTVGQILTHVFNHSTYHRGQIVERMKGKLPVMPATDYIVFLREK